MAELFKLPASSYEEVVKIIKAYSGAKEGTLQTLDDVAQSTGMARTIVSANNGFLVQVGIVTEGNKKSTTEAGRMLGRAYISRIDDEIARIWKDIIAEDEFLTRMVTAVRVRSNMDKASFINHIVYSSGQKDTKSNRAGAGTIIEILKNTGIVTETDGKIIINDQNIFEDTVNKSIKPTENAQLPTTINVSPRVATNSNISHVININLNISCDAKDLDDVSAKIKNLIKEMSQE